MFRLPVMIAGAALLALGCPSPPEGPLEGAGRGASPAPPERIQLLDPVDSEEARPLPSIPEAEPNNRESQAQSLSLPCELLGRIERRGESDWFHITLPEERELRVEVRPVSDLDVAVSLHRENPGKTLRRIQNGGVGEREVIAHVVLNGSALIQIKGRKGTGDYRLAITHAPVPETSEREPNGSVRNATPLRVGSEIRGFANNDEDRDIFLLEGSPDAPRGPWTVQATGAAGTNLRMTLFRNQLSSGSSLRLDSEQEVLAMGVGPTRAEEPVYVAIRCTRGFNVDTPYSVRLLPGVPIQDAIPEPNDTRATAGTLVLETPSRGAIQWKGDVDAWKVESVPGGVLRVEATGIPGLRLRIQALGKEDELLGDAVSPREGDPVALPNVTTSQGPLLVRVSATENGFDPQQHFSIESSWRDSAGEEMEPNDSFESPDPSPLGPAIARRGFLGSSTDRDVYRYHHKEKPALLVLRLRAPPNLPASARLLDHKGEEIAGTGTVAPGSARTLTQYFEPGDYYVEVRGGEGFHAEAPYSVSLLP